jgi:hypothetical protein
MSEKRPDESLGGEGPTQDQMREIRTMLRCLMKSRRVRYLNQFQGICQKMPSRDRKWCYTTSEKEVPHGKGFFV